MRFQTIAACAVLVPALGAASVQAQQGPPRQPPEAATRQIQGFNIVLVLGETQPSGGTDAVDDLPGGAKKALADMREFLPYKHYRVLDSQWTSCCGTDAARLSGRLRGLMAVPGGSNAVNLVQRPYAFSIVISPRSPGLLSVRFGLTLDEGDAHGEGDARGRPAADHEGARGRERADLLAEIATLSLEIRDAQAKVEIGSLAPLDVRKLQDRYASLQRRLEGLGGEAPAAGSPGLGSRPIIDSSFTMDAGETVVVGTSRLGGDKALIALVTAVRRTGSKD